MKLRNKQTGEIGELQITEKHCVVAVGNGTASCGIEIYSSLAELNAEWEYYNEPKLFYVVDLDGEILPSDFENETVEKSKEMGNYFETKEEAEKAVEKLKAWKRLKEANIDYKLTYEYDDFTETMHANVSFSFNSYPLVGKDLDLLFGGEG